MQNKVLFYTSNGIFTNKIQKMEKFLISRGLFDFSFYLNSDFEDFQKKCKEEKDCEGFTVVLCENSKIDELLEIIKSEGDNFSLQQDQAVRLERNSGKNMIFVPIELDFEEFLEDFLPKKDVYVCSLCWVGRNNIKKKFDILKNGFDLEYKIISETRNLHKVFYSKYLEEQRLEFEFGDNLYSFKDESLANRCATIINENNLTLSVAEFNSSGRLIENILREKALSSCVNDALMILDIKQIENLGVSKQLIEEQGGVNHKVLFSMAKSLLRDFKSDVVVTVSFDDSIYFEGSDKKSYITVGNKEKIYQYGFVCLSENRQENLIDFCDYILYRLFIFLKQSFCGDN